MGEEVQRNSFERGLSGGDDDRVMEWEAGLPSADDLTPLSQSLIPRELASAFSISPQPHQTMLDVNLASQNTISTLCRQQSQPFSSEHLKSLPSFGEDEPLVDEGDDYEPDSTTKDGSDARKIRRLDSAEEVESVMRTDNSNDDNNDDHPAARNLKRPRLMWTPQLHKRFVDVVAHLGIKNAVPKTIMQMMNVEGLTRENVASHLQKYRLYLKRMQGLSNEGPSSSDHLFSSTPVPQSFHDSGGASGHHMPLPMPYFVMPMPVIGDAHSYGQMGMPVGNPTAAASCNGFDPHSYNMFMEQQREWSGNKFGPAMSHPHVDPKNK